MFRHRVDKRELKAAAFWTVLILVTQVWPHMATFCPSAFQVVLKFIIVQRWPTHTLRLFAAGSLQGAPLNLNWLDGVQVRQSQVFI